MINDTIRDICILLEEDNLVDFQELPHWCEMLGNNNLAETVENQADSIAYLQNMINIFPYAKTELQAAVVNCDNWSDIENAFDTLGLLLEEEFQNTARLIINTKINATSFFKQRQSSIESTQSNTPPTSP